MKLILIGISINIGFFLTIQSILYLVAYDNIINNEVISNVSCLVISSRQYIYQRYKCSPTETENMDYVNTTIYLFDVQITEGNNVYYGQGCSSYLAFTLPRNQWDCTHYPYQRAPSTNGLPMWLCNQCVDQTCNEYENVDIKRCLVTKHVTHYNKLSNDYMYYNMHDVFFNFLPNNMYHSFLLTLVCPLTLMMIIHTSLLCYSLVHLLKKEVIQIPTVIDYMKHMHFIKNLLIIIMLICINTAVFQNYSFDVYNSRNNIILWIQFELCILTDITYIILFAIYCLHNIYIKEFCIFVDTLILLIITPQLFIFLIFIQNVGFDVVTILTLVMFIPPIMVYGVDVYLFKRILQTHN